MKTHCLECLSSVTDASRLSIIDYLKKSKNEVTVSEVVNHLHLRQPTVTFHINKLVKAGLITKRRNGRQAYLKLHYYSHRCSACPVFD